MKYPEFVGQLWGDEYKEDSDAIAEETAEKLRKALRAIVKQRFGIEDEDFEITDEISMQFSGDRPYAETWWESTVAEVINYELDEAEINLMLVPEITKTYYHKYPTRERLEADWGAMQFKRVREIFKKNGWDDSNRFAVFRRIQVEYIVTHSTHDHPPPEVQAMIDAIAAKHKGQFEINFNGSSWWVMDKVNDKGVGYGRIDTPEDVERKIEEHVKEITEVEQREAMKGLGAFGVKTVVPGVRSATKPKEPKIRPRASDHDDLTAFGVPAPSEKKAELAEKISEVKKKETRAFSLGDF